ncbi:hypothetical protein H6763_02110 [Candidatus Nomurabacteria bacterium]|uniref:Uncharacterized protein n=1 Tax=Candidatus Dojkabacteria bacterium TaxID=2099670 RepID=A0A955I1G8_9BACT|nr:hypothetical protein [Candidatus Dojkabacteria bacterium]MCB9789776.1 hypothetical protein [Candidatus Nomurabacteria bacterium]MCB9803601.1 hypothetical protein [Candidatus Nomurabacteria bacterium]
MMLNSLVSGGVTIPDVENTRVYEEAPEPDRLYEVEYALLPYQFSIHKKEDRNDVPDVTVISGGQGVLITETEATVVSNDEVVPPRTSAHGNEERTRFVTGVRVPLDGRVDLNNVSYIDLAKDGMGRLITDTRRVKSGSHGLTMELYLNEHQDKQNTRSTSAALQVLRHTAQAMRQDPGYKSYRKELLQGLQVADLGDKFTPDQITLYSRMMSFLKVADQIELRCKQPLGLQRSFGVSKKDLSA